jgi:selenocysteine lyase/cysteine desulfurase
MTFAEARASFPVLDRIAYLNAGSMGPLARGTVEAMTARQLADLERGRGGPGYRDELKALREAVRERLAARLAVPSGHVALTYSTSNACSIVVAGLELAPGDEVVTTDVEHFGLLGPLHASGATIRVARVRDRRAADAFEAISALVTPRTRLIAVSHVAWMTGHLLPVEALKRELGLPLLVDGAQSVGAIPVDARAFDFYTVSGQKWLCGPDATGALYLADPERLRVAGPTMLSQEGYEPDGSFTPRAGALRFDSGWIPGPSLAGLLAALDAAPGWALQRAAETAATFRALLEGRAAVITEPGHSTLVTFVAENAEHFVEAAWAEGVVVRDIPGRPWVRVSCGYWTSEDDLERLVAAISPGPRRRSAARGRERSAGAPR